MPYMPPFVVPTYPPIYRQGMRALPTPQNYRYGSSELDAVEGVPTVQLIEQFAPSVAKVIAGLTPEEQVEVLNAKIKNLKKYTNIPVVGLVAQDKIMEYSAQLKALDKIARAEKVEKKHRVSWVDDGWLGGSIDGFLLLFKSTTSNQGDRLMETPIYLQNNPVGTMSQGVVSFRPNSSFGEMLPPLMQVSDGIISPRGIPLLKRQQSERQKSKPKRSIKRDWRTYQPINLL